MLDKTNNLLYTSNMLKYTQIVLSGRLFWEGDQLYLNRKFEPDRSITGPPLPAGKGDFSDQGTLAFAEFATRNMIAATYVEKDKVVFGPVMMVVEHILLGGENDLL